MREPQARSALGTHRHRVAARLCAAAILVLSVTTGRTAHSQIRGRPMQAPSAGWWLSGGAAGAVIGDITDGATGTAWTFGSDPLWLMRGTLEKALDDATTIGVAVSYGKVDLRATPFIALDTDAPPTATPPFPLECAQGCDAQTDLWSLMGQFRSGGGPGFHTFFEATGGVTSFRNMRTRAEGIAIGKPAGTLDLSGTLGGGFGYTLSNGFVIAVVQDFGMGFHSKTGVPSGTSRTWRIRNTRASLRFHF